MKQEKEKSFHFLCLKTTLYSHFLAWIVKGAQKSWKARAIKLEVERESLLTFLLTPVLLRCWLFTRELSRKGLLVVYHAWSVLWCVSSVIIANASMDAKLSKQSVTVSYLGWALQIHMDDCVYGNRYICICFSFTREHWKHKNKPTKWFVYHMHLGLEWMKCANVYHHHHHHLFSLFTTLD